MRPLIVLLASLWLAACSSLQPSPPAQVSNWQQYQWQMSTLKQWQLSGKVGFRTPDDSESAGFRWQQQDDRYQIELFGPLNQLGARIEGNLDYIQLEMDDRRYRAPSPEALLQDHLGWQFPIHDLNWWIRGLPSPDQSYQQKLQDQRLARLDQAGWTIRYLRYSEDRSRPEKLVLQRDRLRITLVIHDWQ
ncbi:lipoprotein insertase outer membrane protein LolB [Marinobacterium arenosum]|uniref:lipoprotein insertase outer membrane protein LolB n=1 Tax=Marinobacterium arenosum TaxID=2862496 RepID=UPI001C985409|nr:lipoprotein insertase outer membrane protein LolB [Marinobacterium arenosum]MBY4675691.1 lipoprotein insertase outer membrane protein LolB [Marinobacterium arenosum]